MSIAHLPASAVFQLALTQSGLDAETAAKQLGWSLSFLKRVLSSERYFPSYDLLPNFCAVVGNALIIDWLYERVTKRIPTPKAATESTLQKGMLDLGALSGSVFSSVNAALSDGSITKTEIRAMLRKSIELSTHINLLVASLREAEKRVQR